VPKASPQLALVWHFVGALAILSGRKSPRYYFLTECEATARRHSGGVIWLHAYDAITAKAGRYVQGEGCTTVAVAGLIQSSGFGSFSKHYGTAASSLLEAEVVTAHGKIRIAKAATTQIFSGHSKALSGC